MAHVEDRELGEVDVIDCSVLMRINDGLPWHTGTCPRAVRLFPSATYVMTTAIHVPHTTIKPRQDISIVLVASFTLHIEASHHRDKCSLH